MAAHAACLGATVCSRGWLHVHAPRAPSFPLQPPLPLPSAEAVAEPADWPSPAALLGSLLVRYRCGNDAVNIYRYARLAFRSPSAALLGSLFVRYRIALWTDSE